MPLFQRQLHGRGLDWVGHQPQRMLRLAHRTANHQDISTLGVLSTGSRQASVDAARRIGWPLAVFVGRMLGLH
jgi:hypothetical protein